MLIPANYSSSRVNYFNYGCKLGYMGQGYNGNYNFQILGFDKIKKSIDFRNGLLNGYSDHNLAQEPVIENSLRSIDYIFTEHFDNDVNSGIAFIYHSNAPLFNGLEEQDEINELLTKYFTEILKTKFIFSDKTLDNITRRLYMELFQIIDGIENELTNINETKYDFLNGEIAEKYRLLEEIFRKYKKKQIKKTSYESKVSNTENPLPNNLTSDIFKRI